MALPTDDELRAIYNSLREEDAEPPELFLPANIIDADPFDHYRMLSAHTLCAWEFAWKIDRWFQSSEREQTERISLFVKSLVGLKVILKYLRLADARGDFRTFDKAATETPSVHVQLYGMAKRQFHAIFWVFSYEGDYQRWLNRTPETWIKMVGNYHGERWQDVDVWKEEDRVRAEIARVEDYLERKRFYESAISAPRGTPGRRADPEKKDHAEFANSLRNAPRPWEWKEIAKAVNDEFSLEDDKKYDAESIRNLHRLKFGDKAK